MIITENQKPYVLLLFLALIFFLLYNFLTLNSLAPNSKVWFSLDQENEPQPLIFNQPDESINYFFIKQLAVNNQFRLPEPLSSVADNQVHPRSTTIVYGGITPIGFPGFIVIIGSILRLLVFVGGIKLFNIFSVLIIPLAACLTPMFFFAFLKRVFDQRIAMISSILLFIHPAWWYCGSRVFQPNILFMFFLILSLVCGMLMIEKQSRLFAWFLGLSAGLVIFIRPSEIVFISALAVVLLLMARKKINFKQLVFIAIGAGVIAILFFCTQILYYGDIFGTGYMIPHSDGSAGSILTGWQGKSFLYSLILPFGFNLKAIFLNLFSYSGVLFGAWLIVGLLSLIYVIFPESSEYNWIKKRKHFSYLLLFVFFSFYLLVFYGSWQFSDNLDMRPSIGTSYVRYFLPIYVFSLPLIAYFLIRLVRWQKFGRYLMFLALISLIFSSLISVYLPLDALFSVRNAVADYYNWQNKVYALTEQNAVIVTRYGDKYIYPGRKVIAGFEEPQYRTSIIKLLQTKTPVYLYDLKLTNAEEGGLGAYLEKHNAFLSTPLLEIENLQLRKFRLSNFEK